MSRNQRMSDKPTLFWSNFMAMHSTENEAKEGLPKAEHEDIRCYVRKDQFDKLESKLYFCAGLISTMDQFRDKHPEDVLEWINKECEKL